MNNKGVTLTELLISTAILSIIMMSLADFSLDILNVADRHSQQILKVQNSRLSLERISEQIRNSSYIFPKGKDISFTIESGGGYSYESKTVNTNDAIALLVPSIGYDYSQGDNLSYNLVVFYLDENGTKSDLYEFSTNYPSVYWDENTIPEISYAYGTTNPIAKNIVTDSSNLSYILQYENNNSTDEVLKSELQGAISTDSDALIKGADWSFTIKQSSGETDVEVQGISRNIPRYIQDYDDV